MSDTETMPEMPNLRAYLRRLATHGFAAAPRLGALATGFPSGASANLPINASTRCANCR